MSTETYGPGLHTDIPEPIYHALPGLSSTGIHDLLIDPPARYWHKKHHRKASARFDLGSAAHELILDSGPGLVIIDALDYRSKAAQAKRDGARAVGLTPVLRSEYAQVQAMLEAVHNHPDASQLLEIGSPNPAGRAEVSSLWEDPETGASLRGRFDYLHPGPLIVDVKTCRSADPDRFARHAVEYGYDTQAAHYLNGLAATRGDTDALFFHVLVEIEPPYLVSVVELDADFLRIGRESVRVAIDLYNQCTTQGQWPGIPQGIHRVAPPPWHHAPTMKEELT